jgi:hypothetical protein
MLGGGTFTVQNKILNGAYINFVSASKASANLADRGVATMPLELDWGVDNAVFEVTPADFQKNSTKIFGYPFTHEKMKGLRDLFLNIKTLYAYKLTSGGTKASNTYATAKYSGVRGNDLKIVIAKNVDESAKFDVKVYMETALVFEQIAVASMADLTENDFVDWKSTATMAVTAATPLSGGTNGTVDGTAHQTYLDKIEPYSFNTMGVVVTDDTTKNLYVAFVKRMRDQVGMKFQCVLHNKSADYEGVINVKNDAVGSASVADLVYWVTGAEAGCAINKTLLNRKYDGEFTVDVDHKQSVLETAMQSGEFMFHNVNGDVRVLSDINSFVSGTDEKSIEIFGENQCVRVMDQIANDIAVLFNTKYLGQVPNDVAGRISLWNDIVKHHNKLQDIRAIQEFNPDDVTVNQGEAKNSVVVGDAVTIVVGMAKLYMTVTVQ